MYKFLQVNVSSFAENDTVKKSETDVKMSKKDFVDEHKHLVKVLNSDSKVDDKKEAKDQKEELDAELEKAGAGSKGGKIIGYTKSGKAIYESQSAKHESKYNSQDHKDAAYLHLDTAQKHFKEKNQGKGEAHDSHYVRHMETSRHKKLNEELDAEDLKNKNNLKKSENMNMQNFNVNNSSINMSGFIDIEKGRKAVPIGTVKNGMKKVAEGKWVPEKEGTHIQHGEHYYAPTRRDNYGSGGASQFHSKTGERIVMHADDIPEELHGHEKFKEGVGHSKHVKDLNESITGKRDYPFHRGHYLSHDKQKEIIKHAKSGGKVSIAYANGSDSQTGGKLLVSNNKNNDESHRLGKDQLENQNFKHGIRTSRGSEIYYKLHGKDDEKIDESEVKKPGVITKETLNDAQKIRYKDAIDFYTRMGKSKETAEKMVLSFINASPDKKVTLKKSEDVNNELSKSISRDELIKSHIGSQFGYSENLKVNKKGAEIKEKLITIKDAELSEISTLKSKAEVLKEKAGSEPTEKLDDYVTDGIKTNTLLLKYPWNECYCNEQTEKSLDGIEIKSEAHIVCDSKQEYNRCVEKIARCESEVSLINTMINNFEDAKVYNLSVKQATTLGF